MSIKFENGLIRISEKAIEEIAKKKGFNLKCKIEEGGIKIDLEKEFLGMEVPVRIFIPKIELEEKILKIINFKINLSSMPIPLISILPFIKKYPYLALDSENSILNINLKRIIPDYIDLKIEEILLKNGEIEAKINNLTITL